MLDLMTGNLSRPIEHRLFPELPAKCYAALAIEVRAVPMRPDHCRQQWYA